MCAERARATNSISIRPCVRDDVGALESILADAPEAANWSARGLEEILEHHARYFLVALRDGIIGAFIAGRQVAEEGEILNLAVKTDFRRHGLGTALVRRLLEVFERDGVRAVYLEVRESNAVAVSFYRGLGFSQVGSRAGYYHDPDEPALLLRTSLRPFAGKETPKTRGQDQ